MRVLFIGGIFDSCHNPEVIRKTKTYVEYAANNFQRKIIEGLKLNGVNVEVISAPFVGAYPRAYSDLIFRGFNHRVIDKSGYRYVNFINLWGIRNFSRKRAIKKELDQFIASKDSNKLILVYTPHTPFIEAATYAKRKDPKIKICLVIPDLPQYMNLADKVSPVYKVLKRYDVNRFLNQSQKADSFVLLTKYMRKPLKVNGRPYMVVEGIYEERSFKKTAKKNDTISIVYTGKLDRSFGIMNLVKAFSTMKDNRLRLIICGAGEERDNVVKAARDDHRILYKGQVSSDEAFQEIINGDILVNPRQNDSDYTKFSFPSKIIDYLSTYNPVVAYKLDGMPKVYENLLYFVPDNTIEALQKTIYKAINESLQNKEKRNSRIRVYLRNNLSKEHIGRSILELNNVRVDN